MKIAPFIHYQLGAEGLEVLVGRWPVRRIRYDDIESVRRGYRFWNEHWTSRIDISRTAVTIRRRSGIMKNFVITPDDPDAFVSELQGRLHTSR